MIELDTSRKSVDKSRKGHIKRLSNLTVNVLVYLAAIIKKKVTFLHRAHIHHLYNFHFRKNHFLYQSKPLIKRMANLK